MMNKPIRGLVTTMGSKKGTFETGDVILTIDKKELSEFNFRDDKLVTKKRTVKIIRSEDTLLIEPTKNEFESLLRAAPAMTAGLRTGDDIIAINDRTIQYYDDIESELFNSKGKYVNVKVKREEEEIEFKTYVTKKGSLGFIRNVEMSSDSAAIETIYYGFGASIGKGISKGYTTWSDYAGQLKFLFTKKGASSMGGFGAIGSLFPSSWDWQKFWLNTAFISIILAFMNILPIPALDGGHVMFLLYEIITGKEAPEKVLEIAQYIGFFLIIGLVLYANGNDIYRWLAG
jgi:regulator of sigma E protease